MKILKKILIIYIITILVFSSNIIVFADDEDEEELNQTELQEAVESAAAPMNEPILNAREAIIYDRTTGKTIWGKNENQKRAMASTTKIMTALIVLENCKITDTVTVSKKAAGTGGSTLKIKAGDKITVNDLLYGLMLRSRKRLGSSIS